MKIFVSDNMYNEFWDYFMPKGLIILTWRGVFWGNEYIVSAKPEVLEEVAKFAKVIR